jgi:putative salt-induced outer membrane protein
VKKLHKHTRINIVRQGFTAHGNLIEVSMNRLLLILIVLFALANTPQSAYAQKEFPEEEPSWKGNIEVSYLHTDGNTDAQTFAGAGKIEKEFTRVRITAEGRGRYGQKDDVTTDKNVFGSLKYDQKLTARAFLFALESVERNTLKGIEFRFVHQGGVGYFIFKTSSDTLKIELGAGYVSEVPIEPFRRRGFATGRAFSEYKHLFSKTSRFEQTVEYLPNLSDSEDYIINEESALITNLFGKFALKTSFAVTFDHQPTEGFEKSDRVFKTALLYTF